MSEKKNDIGAKVPSHSEPEGAARYIGCQLRVMQSSELHTTVRWQVGSHEYTFAVSNELGLWLGALPAPLESLANSGAKYFPARARPETDGAGVAGAKVRFQVPGPEKNREWGAVFVAHAPELVPVIAPMLGVEWKPVAAEAAEKLPSGKGAKAAPQAPQAPTQTVSLPGWSCTSGADCWKPAGQPDKLCTKCVGMVQNSKGKQFVCMWCCGGGKCSNEPVLVTG